MYIADDTLVRKLCRNEEIALKIIRLSLDK